MNTFAGDWAGEVVRPSDPPVDLGRNLTYGLLDVLGRAIVDGGYDGASLLSEAELARQHGVGRSVTREAVKMLAAKGLVEPRPGQGSAIQPLAAWNMFDPDVLEWVLARRGSSDLQRQFDQLRAVIEPEAAALAAPFASRGDHERIDAELRRMETAACRREEMLEVQIAFHAAVLRASANPFYAGFCNVMGAALRASPRLSRESSDLLVASMAVRDAIADGDGEAARAAMRRLIGD